MSTGLPPTSGPVTQEPKWDEREIDRYLLILAQATSASLREGWAAVELAATWQGQEWSETARGWQTFLALGPEGLGQCLLSDDEGGRLLRRDFPFYAIAPRELREEKLRDAVRTGQLATAYAARWTGDPPVPEQLVDVLVEHLFAAMNGVARDAFTAFVTAARQTKWIIAADFCLGDQTRPNDVLAFTVFPYDASFSEMGSQIASVFPKDLKNTGEIDDAMIALLRSQRRFHFAFVVNKDRKLLANVAEARDTIDRTIGMMSAYNDADEHRSSIAAMRTLRQEANANNFKAKLLQDIILLGTFAGFIATLLQLEGRAELVGFFPDRDDMTRAYDAIGYATFAINASAFALRRRVPEAQISLALPGPRDDGRKGLYYDELIRIPDYIAGGIAGTDLNGASPIAISQKCIDIVGKALVDNRNSVLLRVNLPPLAFGVTRSAIQSTPPD